MSYVIYVCDVETTGTNPAEHDVIEVCFWRLGDKESKTWHLCAVNESTIQDEALKVNKHKKEDILRQTKFGEETYLPPEKILPEIETWLMEDGAAVEDRVFAGQNPNFDYQFLLHLWKRNNCEESFPFGFWRNHKENQGYILDTIQLTRFIDICTGKKRKFYNLSSLVSAFGVTKATAHRADGDVKMTKDLLEKMMNPLKDVVKENFEDCY